MATVAPRKSATDWTPRRLMAWLRELFLEHGGILAKSDTEPALVSSVDAWFRLRAVGGGKLMVIEHSLVHSSGSRAIT